MTTIAARSWNTVRLPGGRPSRSDAVLVLQVFVITMMVIPSDTVVKAIGAAGYPAGLVGLGAFAAYMAAVVLGFHNPLRHRHPVRTIVLLMWISTLISYVLMPRWSLTTAEGASADRWLMQMAVVTGIVLIAAECLETKEEIRRVLRALVWGGAFCGVVAALQFWLSFDIAVYLRLIPGFEINEAANMGGIMSRAALNRVSGTATYPIELGVVAGMLLPLAVHLALHDTAWSKRKRWLAVGLLALAIPTSVSRSAILAVAIAFAVLIVALPARRRVVAFAAVPFALAAVFMSAPGVISTLTSFFQAGTSDPSIATRVDDYPMVERLVRDAPWFGSGGATYFADDAFDILDNQYLKTAIELGLFGLVAFILFMIVPVWAAIAARLHSRDPELRTLCGALAGAALAAAVCSFTFDSESFPMFVNLHALVIGLVGASCRLARSTGPADYAVQRADAGGAAQTGRNLARPAGG